MGDTSETNTKVLSRELFLGAPIQKNHYLRNKVPFPKSGHILYTEDYALLEYLSKCIQELSHLAL